jgi:hypothetical protein
MRAASVASGAVGFAGWLAQAAIAEAPISVNECQFSQSYGPTVFYEDHTDIGNGFVMYLERYEDPDGGYLVVANCKSGSTLRIEYEGTGHQKLQDYVFAGAASPEKVTLSMFGEHFASLGLSTRLNVEPLEHCACAAFYPEAKGKKGDWERRHDHP